MTERQRGRPGRASASEPDGDGDRGRSPRGSASDRGLWVGVALGGPIVALGVVDALGAADDTNPAELARWVVGGVVVLDAVVIPAALLAGRAIGRRAPLRWALAATATLAVVAWPYVRGYGRDPQNPSVLPRDYGTGLVVAVAAVWVAAIGWWAIARTILKEMAHAWRQSFPSE